MKFLKTVLVMLLSVSLFNCTEEPDELTVHQDISEGIWSRKHDTTTLYLTFIESPEYWILSYQNGNQIMSGKYTYLFGDLNLQSGTPCIQNFNGQYSITQTDVLNLTLVQDVCTERIAYIQGNWILNK